MKSFEKYVKLIQKRAWEYAQKTGYDYDELEAQGYLIYCECLEKFDITKSSFSTYLYIQLNRLNDYIVINNRQSCKSYNLNEYEEQLLESKYETVNIRELLESSKQYLTIEAQNVLEWLISRSWERKGVRTPSINRIIEEFNISKNRAEALWNECKNYWQEVGYYIYS